MNIKIDISSGLGMSSFAPSLAKSNLPSPPLSSSESSDSSRTRRSLFFALVGLERGMISSSSSLLRLRSAPPCSWSAEALFPLWSSLSLLLLSSSSRLSVSSLPPSAKGIWTELGHVKVDVRAAATLLTSPGTNSSMKISTG